jgi:hypothetical protein
MSGKLFLLVCTAVFLFILPLETDAQTSRKAVGAAEVNGTFRSYFKGKFKGSFNEIKILALGKGKLKFRFDLIRPYIDGAGDLSANMGEAEGVGEIFGDTGVFTMEEFGACKILVKFVKPGEIKVEQSREESDCGFGHNVTAGGTYKKFSGAKPEFGK